LRPPTPGACSLFAPKISIVAIGIIFGFMPALRSSHELPQRPSPQKQFLSNPPIPSSRCRGSWTASSLGCRSTETRTSRG
jgi:hypothetical protein